MQSAYLENNRRWRKSVKAGANVAARAAAWQKALHGERA
jgi:hypothetical protein